MSKEAIYSQLRKGYEENDKNKELGRSTPFSTAVRRWKEAAEAVVGFEPVAREAAEAVVCRLCHVAREAADIEAVGCASTAEVVARREDSVAREAADREGEVVAGAEKGHIVGCASTAEVVARREDSVAREAADIDKLLRFVEEGFLFVLLFNHFRMLRFQVVIYHLQFLSSAMDRICHSLYPWELQAESHKSI